MCIRDSILHIYDRSTNTLRNLRVPTPGDFGWALSEDLVGIAVCEDGTDLNGNSDTMDEVFHLFDLHTGRGWNSGLARGSFLDRAVASGNLFVFPVSETRQVEDLDGSGAVENRSVLFAVQPSRPRATQRSL